MRSQVVPLISAEDQLKFVGFDYNNAIPEKQGVDLSKRGANSRDSSRASQIRVSRASGGAQNEMVPLTSSVAVSQPGQLPSVAEVNASPN